MAARTLVGDAFAHVAMFFLALGRGRGRILNDETPYAIPKKKDVLARFRKLKFYKSPLER
jgi:hypothetical protein